MIDSMYVYGFFSLFIEIWVSGNFPKTAWQVTHGR